MRIIRLIFLLVFVSMFMHGKPQPILKFLDHNSVSKKSSDNLKDVKIFNDNSKDECLVRKRKLKTRGIEVVNPIISVFSINKIYVYGDFLIPINEIKYTSFLHCVDHKRGPPILS